MDFDITKLIAGKRDVRPYQAPMLTSPRSVFTGHSHAAMTDGYDRLLAPSLERELHNESPDVSRCVTSINKMRGCFVGRLRMFFLFRASELEKAEGDCYFRRIIASKIIE